MGRNGCTHSLGKAGVEVDSSGLRGGKVGRDRTLAGGGLMVKINGD